MVSNRIGKKHPARQKAKRYSAREKAEADWWRRKLVLDREREFEHGVLAVANILDDKNYRAFLSPYIIKRATELRAFRKQIENLKFSEYCARQSKNFAAPQKRHPARKVSDVGRKLSAETSLHYDAWAAFDRWSLRKGPMPRGMLRHRSTTK
jgi:hypothetical protein